MVRPLPRRPSEGAMRNAVRISAGLHVLLIAASLLKLPWQSAEIEPAISIAEVSILSESEFNAAISQAPQVVPMANLNNLAAPSFEDLDAARPDDEMDVTINDLDGPDDPSDADAEADLTAVLVRNQVEVDSDVTSLAPSLPGAFDTALAPTTSTPAERRPQSVARPAGISSPRPQAPSLRIDTTPAAPPPEEARPDEETNEEIELSTEGTIEQEPQEATAPEEAATEIVPEIAEDLPEPELAPLAEDPLDELVAEAPETGAPLTSARPQARPEIREPEPEPVQTAQTEPETPPAAAEEPASEPASEPVAEPTQTASNAPASGPPIGSGPIDAVRRGMGDHWNINFQGVAGWETFIVTMRFNLSPDGQLVGDPEPIVPQRIDGGFTVAARDARSAIIRAARAGVFAALPRESYGRWQTIEMTFDPGRNAVGFGS
ncbi:hypothetical protein SAMN06273572_101878 [Monaibacterium marinum]|uniref:Cell division and transport-associated protein TolA n=2 Tax=Pontivivens marinum TaxID=1690039 RepID=A0A2C9CNX4_9RHOB|nr:hypothetical protein SAMN06273572_101878 [Monaibacterium marinum]